LEFAVVAAVADSKKKIRQKFNLAYSIEKISLYYMVDEKAVSVEFWLLIGMMQELYPNYLPIITNYSTE
jgi:hypothetical protein